MYDERELIMLIGVEYYPRIGNDMDQTRKKMSVQHESSLMHSSPLKNYVFLPSRALSECILHEHEYDANRFTESNS